MSTITLVTGGNRGIGREVCRQLAGRGHTVILTARSAGAAAAAARAAGAEPLPLKPPTIRSAMGGGSALIGVIRGSTTPAARTGSLRAGPGG